MRCWVTLTESWTSSEAWVVPGLEECAVGAGMLEAGDKSRGRDVGGRRRDVGGRMRDVGDGTYEVGTTSWSHPDAQASATGIVQGISAVASYSLADILNEKDQMDEASGRKMGMVYQVYFQRDRSKTEAQVRQAVEGGVKWVTVTRTDTVHWYVLSNADRASALVLTVDSNVGDNRQSTEKLKGSRFSAEPGPRMGPITETPTFHDPSLNWDDIVWLQSLAQGLPIYLKGVCHIDVGAVDEPRADGQDVRRARDMGLAGCILSNHVSGWCLVWNDIDIILACSRWRTYRAADSSISESHAFSCASRNWLCWWLNRARSGFESLRSIHAQEPQLLKDFEVYIDGGIRRGSDVLKAVALGARGVGLGRPFLFAQAAYGDKGVIRAVRSEWSGNGV
jgi:L-lactate dehydrogenase (cytochrome)